MIKTWAASIKPLYNETLFQEYFEKAPKFRQEKAARMHRIQGKAQSIGAWSLYERMKTEYGIESNAAYNLSHSGDYVLCSVHVSDGEEQSVRVGCDIEEMKDCRPKIAGRFFCGLEYEQVMGEKDADKQKEIFYRYWVLKESFAKATRRGLAIGLNTYEIRLGDPSVLIKQPEDFPEAFIIMESRLEEYRIAVCSTDNRLAPLIQAEFGKTIRRLT